MSNYTGTDNLEVMAEAVNYNRFLLSLIRRHARRTDAIVDFGSGIGTFARELRDNGYRVHCIEPDAAQAAVISAAGLPVSASLAALQDDSVDYLYTLNVLEHIEDDGAALRELRAKLKPDGKLLVYVPAFQVLYSSMDRKVGHFRRYTRRELTGKLRQAGFHVTTARYADSIGFFASLVFRFAGGDSGTLNRKALILYDRIVFPLSRLCDFLFSPFFGKNVVAVARR
ncbi:MAG TPA: class I SAM-dependent methyltransferase [Paucimonas sp.]|nr:class I SAM-dependent methyltransferase [Paucimonas sp.]